MINKEAKNRKFGMYVYQALVIILVTFKNE